MIGTSFKVLDWGKMAGRSLPQALWLDPDYFFFLNERHAWSWELRFEASFLAKRARSIRVPVHYGPTAVVEYHMERSGKFAGLKVLTKPLVSDGGGTSSYANRVIDLGASHDLANYDKSGAKLLVRDAKEILFGNASFKMTKDRAEAFFSDDRNFHLSPSP